MADECFRASSQKPVAPFKGFKKHKQWNGSGAVALCVTVVHVCKHVCKRQVVICVSREEHITGLAKAQPATCPLTDRLSPVGKAPVVTCGLSGSFIFTLGSLSCSGNKRRRLIMEDFVFHLVLVPL